MIISESERQLFSIDPLNHKFPIYICSRDLSLGGLRTFFDANSSILSTIKDQTDIEAKIESVYNRIKYIKPFNKLKDCISTILDPFSISYEAFGFSISHAAANRKPSDNTLDQEIIIYIKQDSLDPNQVNRLISLYQEIPFDERPMMFFEPVTNDVSFVKSFSGLNENVEIKPIGQVRNWAETDKWKVRIKTVDEFIERFLSYSFTSCTNAKSILVKSDDFKELSPQELISNLALESLIIKSYDASGNKFKALPVARNLLKKIETAKSYMGNNKQLEYLLSLKAIVNLWLAYIDESFTKGIDNSFSIAEYLKNDYLKAHCFRLAHLVSGYSSLSDHLVSKATEYFYSAKDDEGYVYSQNNYLLNKLGTSKVDFDAFAELACYAVNETPYIDRLSTIINNAGTAYLIAGNYDKAMEFYNNAGKYSGQPIHHVGIEINKLITRYMDGEKLQANELLRVFRKIIRVNLPKGFAYHQSYIFWTIAKLSDFDPDVTDIIFKHLKKKMFMNYENVLNEKETMVDFLANSNLLNKGKGRFTGPRGDFIHRTQVFPVIHFQWM